MLNLEMPKICRRDGALGSCSGSEEEIVKSLNTKSREIFVTSSFGKYSPLDVAAGLLEHDLLICNKLILQFDGEGSSPPVKNLDLFNVEAMGRR